LRGLTQRVDNELFSMTRMLGVQKRGNRYRLNCCNIGSGLTSNLDIHREKRTENLTVLSDDLAVLPKIHRVPCIRATFRAVFAARRKPRPTPAAKLSGFLDFLRRAVMGLVPAIAVPLRSCHRLPNHPPRADRVQES